LLLIFVGSIEDMEAEENEETVVVVSKYSYKKCKFYQIKINIKKNIMH